MKQRHYLFLFTISLVVVWVAKHAIQSSNPLPFVRTVSGLPSQVVIWDVYDYAGMVFAIPAFEKAPYQLYRIDPNTEMVVESKTVEQLLHPQAAIALHYQLPEAWLAEKGFFIWEIDPVRKVAYAAKPPKMPSSLEDWGYTGIYIVNTETREIKNFVEHQGFLFMALHPSGLKLYVESPLYKIKVLDTTKVDWVKEIDVMTDYFALPFAGFSVDGRYLFAARTGKLIVIDTEKEEVVEWGKQINEELDRDYDAGVRASMSLSGDKTELYAALTITGDKVNVFDDPEVKARGGVAAIDIAQKKVVRVLGLTRERECSSVAVVGNKLFIASREGKIFVVDTDRWRQGG